MIYKFSALAIKILVTFFTETKENKAEIHMEPHKILSNQAVLRKKNKVRGRHHTLSFQNILQSYSNQEYDIGNNILLFGSDTKITGEKVELDDWDHTNYSKQSAS